MKKQPAARPVPVDRVFVSLDEAHELCKTVGLRIFWRPVGAPGLNMAEVIQ